MNPDFKDAKILIVDDEVPNIELLQDFLLIKGYQNIRVTKDSREVFSIVNEFNPDIILLDLMMPYLSGFDIMYQLNEENILHDGFLKVLILTADSNEEIKKKALAQGASDFLTKPFDLIEVDLRIKNLLMSVYLLSKLNNTNLELEEKVKERTIDLRKLNDELIIAKNKVELNLIDIQNQNKILRDIGWTQSHVVRSPLSRMMAAISVLEMKGVDTTHKEEITDIILSSAHELDAIIRDISERAFKAKVL